MQKMNFLVNTIEEKDDYGVFAIEPLLTGFGHTIGNALRRVLLSSFKGAAITDVKVAGVNHKFSTLAGLSEDMIDLILNLKSVKVAYEGDEPVTAKLSIKGPKVVTAKDIIAPATVKIVSGDIVIANLGKDAKLDLELTIGTGYGYSSADERPSSTIGTMSIDAIYSPVERVSYKVEATRVGRRTDFDKVVMEIYTDGSERPSVVLKEAARILVASFSQIVDPVVSSDSDETASASSSVATDDLGLPTRVTNALKVAGYKTAQELTTASDKDLKTVKNLGSKSLGLIDAALSTKGLTRAK
ncbi:DNA-directed RNA polymerase subunit alpha [Candidatus Collierbacteria bacterium CG17_big_fil_post_rev_8_21_14_2_50_45_7]|uniref:DNA-directed RNA polymerase subunit alpha n=1 Tax=Candidatus Collierbacteria bacterium CG17_big_fil_post_rev_8_21_14_2_50_45_7 TaxID=1974536 RepID=A0A2M7FRL5_9BACT|nr:MAG: DNA-directed RNA polymerase subunit alpha [Candidatus Collierbacteria bacterium CG17_big_fil_post_rev_8_21_14_2_50_45_7]